MVPFRKAGEVLAKGKPNYTPTRLSKTVIKGDMHPQIGVALLIAPIGIMTYWTLDS